MMVLIKRMVGESKLKAVKCLRAAIDGLSLQAAVHFVQSLPRDIDVLPDRVGELRSQFDIAVGECTDPETLFERWHLLSQKRKGELLGFLDATGRLREESL